MGDDGEFLFDLGKYRLFPCDDHNSLLHDGTSNVLISLKLFGRKIRSFDLTNA